MRSTPRLWAQIMMDIQNWISVGVISGDIILSITYKEVMNEGVRKE